MINCIRFNGNNQNEIDKFVDGHSSIVSDGSMRIDHRNLSCFLNVGDWLVRNGNGEYAVLTDEWMKELCKGETCHE